MLQVLFHAPDADTAGDFTDHSATCRRSFFMLPKTKIPEISPIAFCRQIKSLATGMTLEQIIMAESDRGVFKEYCLILSRELNVPLATVKTKWGAGIEFPKMPRRVQLVLKFVLRSRVAEINESRMAA
jgi:hypothetical protein